MYKKNIFMAVLAVVFTVSSAGAQEYRNKLSSPPNVYYKEMLKRSLTGEYDMILQVLNQVRPITTALQSKYGARLHSEINYAVKQEQQEEIIYLVLNCHALAGIGLQGQNCIS